MKICSKCSIEINESNFCTGNPSRCSYCYNFYRRLNYPNKRKAYQSAYAKSEAGKRTRRKTEAKHRSKNSEYKRKWQDNKLKTDPLYKLQFQLRHRTKMALRSKQFSKTSTLKQYIGCTLEQLKQHLESQFQPGMTWDNHSKYGWHIDHIIPLASAKTEEELYKLCHYTNLQPLWAYDNLSKGAKYVKSNAA